MRKTPLQRTRCLFMIALMIVAAGCQSEDFTVEKERLDGITSRKISFDEMSLESGAMKAVAPFLRNRQQNVLARNLVYDEKYGFYVDTDEILMKQQGDDITFTLMVYRDNPDGKTENLVLTKQADGNYAVYLAKYNLSEGDKTNLSEGAPILDIGQKMEFFALNTPSGSTEGGTFKAGDIVRLTDGTCWRITEIIAYTYIPWVILGVQVECAAQQDTSNSYSEDGQGGGGASQPHPRGTVYRCTAAQVMAVREPLWATELPEPAAVTVVSQFRMLLPC